MIRLGCIFLLVLSLTAEAEIPQLGKKGPSRGRDVRPELSTAGRIQAQKDLKILRGNIRKLKQNIATAQGNLRTLNQELEELRGLEKSHEMLRGRIAQYVRVAESSLDRNESAKQELQELEARLLPSIRKEARDDPELKSRMKELAEQTREREDWRQDTERKKARVMELGKRLERNLAQVLARIPPIERQIVEWKEKIRELEGELDRMQLQERRLAAKAK